VRPTGTHLASVVCATSSSMSATVRVPSTQQGATASCRTTRVLVSYSAASSGCPVHAAASWDPLSYPDRSVGLARASQPGHLCRGKAKKRRRQRQRLLGRHVVPAASRRCRRPKGSLSPHIGLAQPSRCAAKRAREPRGKLSLSARSDSAAAAASEAQLIEPEGSIAAPAGCCVRAWNCGSVDRARSRVTSSFRCTGGEGEPSRADRGCPE